MFTKTIQLCTILIVLTVTSFACRVDGSLKTESYDGGPIVGFETCGATVDSYWIAYSSDTCGGTFCVDKGCKITQEQFVSVGKPDGKQLADQLYADCKAGKLPIVEVYSATDPDAYPQHHHEPVNKRTL